MATDPALYAKMAAKSKLSLKSLREGVSKRANRWHVAPEAAQILWAQAMGGISTGRAMKRLDPHVQEQVRGSVAVPIPTSSGNGNGKAKGGKGRRAVRPGTDAMIRALVGPLLSDPQLKRRCATYFTASHSFDRAFREATTVLEDRLRKLGGVKGGTPEKLIAQTLNPPKHLLEVSDHADVQTGFFHLVLGLHLVFRNPTHHGLNDQLTREDALRFCGSVDTVLGILGKAQVKQPHAGP
jgi:hypothetical protein